MANEYSQEWFEIFSAQFPRERTAIQFVFLRKQLPFPKYKRVLDVCSGPGRIAGPLAKSGYEVTAVDRNRGAITEGTARHPGVRFVELDMRKLQTLGGKYDAAICLWQSFGYFYGDMNRKVLASMGDLLAEGGRLILDVYDPRYFEARQGVETQSVGGRNIKTERRISGKRMIVTIEYDTGKIDEFDWELYTPREITEMGVAAGLSPVLVCSDFNEAFMPGEGKASFQAVFQKP